MTHLNPINRLCTTTGTFQRERVNPRDEQLKIASFVNVGISVRGIRLQNKQVSNETAGRSAVNGLIAATRTGILGRRKKLEFLVKTISTQSTSKSTEPIYNGCPASRDRSSAYEMDSDRWTAENRSLRTMSSAMRGQPWNRKPEAAVLQNVFGYNQPQISVYTSDILYLILVNASTRLDK